ncbi:MAG: cysteine-rich CWC family protein [Phycisphaerales bacterium]|nr:cysteine-rich CWC family protein [Phycisphaerales bacterium]
MPFDAAHCPLCGQPNACALADRTATRSCSDCWCARTTIAPAVLARIPVAARGVACVCARCAASGDAAAPPGEAPRPAR